MTLGFPRHNRRGHIEANHRRRGAGNGKGDFRAITGAVTLKQCLQRARIVFLLDFRAITGAVTLKHAANFTCDADSDIFPRHNRRGHIEAPSPSPPPPIRSSHFRAITGAVTLKLALAQAFLRTRAHFRAITGAVTLKPCLRCGQMEPQLYFRAITGAVTLKPTSCGFLSAQEKLISAP